MTLNLLEISKILHGKPIVIHIETYDLGFEDVCTAPESIKISIELDVSSANDLIPISKLIDEQINTCGFPKLSEITNETK